MIGDIPPPPAIYDHEFGGRDHVRRLSSIEVDKLCRFYGAKGTGEVVACALRLGEDFCIMVLPQIGVGGIAQRTYDLIVRHETGHCNGWRHD